MQQQIDIDHHAFVRPAGRGVGVSSHEIRQFAGQNRRVHQVLDIAVSSLMNGFNGDAKFVGAVEVFDERRHCFGLGAIVGILVPVHDSLSTGIKTLIAHVALRLDESRPQRKQDHDYK